MAAVAASIALHAGGWALLRRSGALPVRPISRAAASPRDLEIVEQRGRLFASVRPSAAQAPGEAGHGRRGRRQRQLRNKPAPEAVAAQLSALETPSPRAAAPPLEALPVTAVAGGQGGVGSAVAGGLGGPAASGSPGVVGAGEGLLDLSPYLDRIRRSASSCAPRRLGAAVGRPRLARVRFCVGSRGEATAISLVESSGSAAFDRAAVDCVIPGAAPFPPIDRCLVVPLRFH